MIIKEINIFSQNICKNNLLTNTILETQRDFDIKFIQELPWSIIRSIPSFSNKEGEKLVGIPNHPNWITFSKNPSNSQDLLRVITYINIRLSTLCFSLCKDIFYHRDISYISFFNCSSIYFLMKVYSDSSQTAFKYFNNTEANINNILIMTGDFNIRDSSWDPLFSNHLVHSNMLTDIANSLNLCISSTTV